VGPKTSALDYGASTFVFSTRPREGGAPSAPGASSGGNHDSAYAASITIEPLSRGQWQSMFPANSWISHFAGNGAWIACTLRFRQNMKTSAQGGAVYLYTGAIITRSAVFF
jgi:hypothetical protein